MPSLSMDQIGTIAYSIGFRGQSLAIAIAVAMAESSGDPNAVGNNTDGSTDTGLWQINSVHRASRPSWTISWLKNPYNNAQAAWIVSSSGKKWNPWVTYAGPDYKGSDGSWRRFAAEAKRSAKRVEAVKGGGSGAPNIPTATGFCWPRVNRIAAAEIGVREVGNNDVKYWHDLYREGATSGSMIGQPWCVGFVNWCLWKAGWKPWNHGIMYHCNFWLDWARRTRNLSNVAHPGDLCIWEGGSHIEFVERVVSQDHLVTIGGNTGRPNGVYRQTRTKKSGYFPRYFVRPPYDLSADPNFNPYVPIQLPNQDQYGEYDGDGALRASGVYTFETLRVIGKWVGLPAITGEAQVLKAFQQFCGLPPQYQTGKLDYVTIQCLQWRSDQNPITGAWTEQTIRSLQSYLGRLQRNGWIV